MREEAKTCIVITSDYLANAGDKMDFLKKGKVIPTLVSQKELGLFSQRQHTPARKHRYIGM
jgi:hypothetical protein